MRELEQQKLALECLRLAAASIHALSGEESLLGTADAFYAFVTGEDSDAAHAKLDKLRAQLETAQKVLG